MRSDPIFAIVVSVVLILLVVLSRRLCRRGKRTSAATKPPRATRDPKPFTGLTCKPVAYLGPADKYFGPLPTRLRSVNQPVIRTRNGFSAPHPTQLACI
jgi:hypothetical protein